MEALRPIMGKTINWILKDDIQESAGRMQIMTRLKARAEAAIHSVRLVFQDT